MLVKWILEVLEMEFEEDEEKRVDIEMEEKEEMIVVILVMIMNNELNIIEAVTMNIYMILH